MPQRYSQLLRLAGTLGGVVEVRVPYTYLALAAIYSKWRAYVYGNSYVNVLYL